MAPSEARLVRFTETGPASVLTIVTEPVEDPREGEVRLRVEAIGLNRAEVMFREGAYLEQPPLPSKIGYEAAGTIDAVGKNVDDFKIGDRVSTIPAFSMGQYGVYGERPVVPAAAVAKYPEKLSPREGTAIWMQYITAYGALIGIGRLSKGQSVIITAASSSVGIAAIQIAKNIGALVIATTRGASKAQMLLDAGADHVVQTDTENLEDRVSEITEGAGAHVIFDPIGGPILDQLAAAAAPGAQIIEYGALDSRPTPFPLFAALGKGLTIRGYTLFEITHDPDLLAKAKAFIYQGLETGDLVPLLDRTFAFDDVRQAHEYMESNQQFGKITLTLDGS
ncbi:MAG: NADPH:quinone reductase [Alphaproteobacteria bacterium]|nr:MAG: NADPH:quinone reductase [Alphaproteobacteria bacterium]